MKKTALKKEQLLKKNKDVEEKSSWQNTFQRVSGWCEGSRDMLMKMVLESYG